MLARDGQTKLGHFYEIFAPLVKRAGGKSKKCFFGLTNPELLISFIWASSKLKRGAPTPHSCVCVYTLTLLDPRFIHLLLLGLYYFLYTWPVLRVEPGLHPARRHIPRILQALRKPTRSCALSHFPLYNWHSRHIGQVFWTPKLTHFIAEMQSGMNLASSRMVDVSHSCVQCRCERWDPGAGKSALPGTQPTPNPPPPFLYPHNYSHLLLHPRDL